MQNQTMFMLVLIGIFASIFYCSGDTCYCTCCSGNFCTPTLQGTITVSSCASSSCKVACQSTYPRQCTDGAGRTSYQCTSDTGKKPNWAGIFAMTNRCDKTTCCCPIGEMVLTYENANSARIKCQFAGQACPQGAVSLDQIIVAPTGFSTAIGFMGDTIQVTLSQDSGTIQFNNPLAPSCNEIATRAGSSTAATINLALIPLLVGLMTFKLFML